MIGNGVVIDPAVLLAELDGLDERGVDTSRLLISADAHLIMPYHRAIDKVTERYLGKARIGTTGRGIGPAYGDKVARIGIRVQDLLDPSILRPEGRGRAGASKNQILVKIYNRKALDVGRDRRRVRSATPSGFRHRASPTPGCCWARRWTTARTCCWRARRARCSTSTTAPIRSSPRPTRPPAAPAAGSGIGPTRITRVIGILKAYTTRVGSGPFPTELFDDIRRVPAQDRRRGRRDHRPAAPLRLVRRGHRPVRDPGQRHHRLLPHQARRAVRAGAGADLRRLRRRRRAGRRDADDPDRASTTPSRSTSSCPAGSRTSRQCRDLRRPAGRTRRPTCGGWRSCPAPGSPRSASAPAATRPSCCTTSSRSSSAR